MEPPPRLVDLAASEGVRRLAITQLEIARAARDRIPASADPEALHDYRVALRRLRSCLRSYRGELASTVTGKSRRLLRRLARATNRSRDLEVHLKWLAAQQATAGALERPGIAWLTARLEEDQGREREEMLAQDERLFPGVHRRLRRQLMYYPVMVRLDGHTDPPTTATAAARQLERAARRLERRLGGITGEHDETEIHRARIAAKHLRYLLEPIAADLPGGGALIERLKGLQDTFGDVHDAHVFLPTLRSALADAVHDRRDELGEGIRRLVISLRARASDAFGKAAQEWLEPGRYASFLQEVSSAGQALPGQTRRRPLTLSPPPRPAQRQPGRRRGTHRHDGHDDGEAVRVPGKRDPADVHPEHPADQVEGNGQHRH
jgi:CHAD domain-containing protein